jgi:uncharacterized repeat protein (TIGR01451 family)
MKKLIFAAALALSSASFAQTGSQAVTLKSTAFVVKQVPDATGKLKNVLQTPERVLPGDVLVFILDYRNTAAKPATNFVINNPMPSGVSFTGTEEKWAVVSVDGGKSFGPLTTLKVPKGDGTMRAAIPQDVTAVRWTVGQPIPAGGTGKVQFYGIVK